MYGQHDWFESRDATSLIARIVNAKSPGRGTFVEVPRMDHHFTVYPSAEAAFREEGGQVNPDPAVDVMLEWLQRILADKRKVTGDGQDGAPAYLARHSSPVTRHQNCNPRATIHTTKPASPMPISKRGNDANDSLGDSLAG